MTFHAIESFPFGDVVMMCVSSPPLGNALVVQRIGFVPNLSKGMAVDLVAAYRISFKATFPVHDFSFDFVLAPCDTTGDANSGECLDAQAWPIGNGLLMFGTEDGDALRARMPWLEVGAHTYPIEYLPNGFRIAIPYVPPSTDVGFHFVLAYNQFESPDDSEWFAVDVPHDQLRKYPVAKHIAGAVEQ